MTTRTRISADVRKRALDLLASGKVTLPEIAEVMGVSTQSIWNWCREAGIDWRKIRRQVVLKEWSRINR